MESAEQFAKRFLKKKSALEEIGLCPETINRTLSKGALLVVETRSCSLVMGRYVPCEPRENYPYWLVLAPCVVNDIEGDRRLKQYKLDLGAVERLSYVRTII